MENNQNKNESLVLTKKCKFHSMDFVGICIHKGCSKNGPVCYNCVFFEHNLHPTACVPLTLWKFDNQVHQLEVYNLENHIEKVMVRLKDLDMVIQNNFSEMYEKLHLIKENFVKEGINSFIGNDLPFWLNYKKVDNEYIIDNSNAEKMITNIEKTLICEFENSLSKEFKKIKNPNDSKPILKSGRRVLSINNNWSHTKSYYDCIGFRTNEPGIELLGFGFFELDNKKGLIEVSIYEDSLDSKNLLLKDQINIASLDIVFNEKIGDLFLSKSLPIEKGKKYILVKINLEDNPSGSYGKQMQGGTDPFIFIDMKEESKTFKTGNYTDINTGAFPYLIYK